PTHFEFLALDFCLARKTDPRDSSIVIRCSPFPQVMQLQGNRPVDTADAQSSRHFIVRHADSAAAGTLERNSRMAHDIQEIKTPQMFVSLWLPGPNFRRGDRGLQR